MIVENTVIPVQRNIMDKTKADIFFENFPKDKILTYKEYWASVQPQNTDDIFRRYLFAYCSVHTTFQGNVKGYQATFCPIFLLKKNNLQCINIMKKRRYKKSLNT